MHNAYDRFCIAQLHKILVFHGCNSLYYYKWNKNRACQGNIPHCPDTSRGIQEKNRVVRMLQAGVFTKPGHGAWPGQWPMLNQFP